MNRVSHALRKDIFSESQRLPRRSSVTIRGNIAVFLLFVALTLAMLYPYPRNLSTHLRDNGDSLEYAWVLGYSAKQLLSDPLRLFDGNIFYPFKSSLAYSDSTIASTMTVLPVIMATDNPVLAANLVILMTFVLSGFGTYLLVHDLTGNRFAGILAGIVFAFNPFRIDHLFQVPNVASHWMPFVFFALHRFLKNESPRWAVGFGAFLSLQLLSSFYHAYAIGIAVAVYLLAILAWRPKSVLRREIVVPIAGATFVSLAVLFVVALPYFEVAARYDMRRTLGEASFYSARPENYLGVLDHSRIWGRIQAMVDWGDAERRLFPGLLAVVLALIGLLKGAHREVGVRFALVGLFAFVLSLGPRLYLTSDGEPIDIPFALPYAILFEYLPGFQSMRVPARFAIVVMLSLSVLAGLGVAFLLEHLSRIGKSGWAVTREPVARTVIALTMIAFSLAEYASFPIPMQPIATGSNIPEVYQWLRSQPVTGALVEIPVDDNAFRQAPYAYFSTYHRWNTVNGWRSFTPPGYRELASVLQDFPSAESIAVAHSLGLKYVLVHGDMMPDGDISRRELRLQNYTDQVRVAERFGSDYVFEILNAPPANLSRLSIVAPCSAQPAAPVPAQLVIDGLDRRITTSMDIGSDLFVPVSWIANDARRFHQTLRVRPPPPVFASATSVSLPLVAPPIPGTYQLVVGELAGFGVPAPKPIVVEDPTLPGDRAMPGREPQVASFDLPRKAGKATDSIPLRISWKANSLPERSGVVFVNVYDRNFRTWTIDQHPAFVTGAEARRGCDDDWLEVRLARLHRDTPPGYYWVEFGVMDPVTSRRLLILDPDGRSVEKLTAGPIRLGRPDAQPVGDITPQNQVLANLDDLIQFNGWAIWTDELKAGDAVRLSLYWQALRTLEVNQSVFLHLYDQAGRLLAQYDGPAGGTDFPSILWQPGDVIEDMAELRLPSEMSTGDYTLAVGIYNPNTSRRLPLRDGPTMGDDRIQIGQLRIVGSR
jgi:hypothetical protein